MQVEAATGSVVRSWSYPPPWGASHSGQHPNGAQQKARRLVGAPVEKVRLELVPRTAAAKEALEAKGLHPYQVTFP